MVLSNTPRDQSLHSLSNPNPARSTAYPCRSVGALGRMLPSVTHCDTPQAAADASVSSRIVRGGLPSVLW